MHTDPFFWRARLVCQRAETGHKTISNERNKSGDAACLECGHVFTLNELAAMAAIEDEDDLCVIDCSACGAHNVVRSAQGPGFDKQPRIKVLRTAKTRPETAGVFRDSVEPGVRMPPIPGDESD